MSMIIRLSKLKPEYQKYILQQIDQLLEIQKKEAGS